VGLGNLRANGHPNGGPWRQFHCTACAGYFLETHGTIFHGKRVDPQKVVRAVAALAEGLSIRAVACVFEVDPNTVLTWLVEAAAHLQAFSRHFLHDVQVTQVQLDELFALLSAVKDGTVTEAEAMQCLLRAPHWVLSQSCFFESLGACKLLNFRYPIFGFCLQNGNLRQNPRDRSD
jgi:hypothetical protein